jgi:hypothetical protein
MDLQSASRLISILKEENKTNSQEDKEFNLVWIELIKTSMGAAIEKHYGIRNVLSNKYSKH